MPTNPEFRKLILIGLGGSGQLILLHLKRLFMDTYGVVPPSIKLLALDTDVSPGKLRSNVSETQYSLDIDEFLHMKVTDPLTFIQQSTVVKKWYAKPMPVGAISAGTGGIRQNGRMALFYYIQEFHNRIGRMRTEINHLQLPTRMANAKTELGATTNFKLSDRDEEVYVCGSLAGGTGSGTFLDIGILLRHALPDSLIQGFFLLNWIYRNKAFAHRIHGNTYAALAELDNLQSIKYGSKEFIPYSMSYGDTPIQVDQPPYTLFHLIDGRNENGENVNDASELCDLVGNAIFLSLGSMGDPVNSVIDNLKNHISTQSPKIWDGRYARYSTIGVSSIYYPACELHRLVSLDNAIKHCRTAIAEVEGKDTISQGPPLDQDINSLINNLTLTRTNIRLGSCPFHGDGDFEVQNYQIADSGFPGLISDAIQDAEKDFVNGIQQSHDDKGKAYLDSILLGIRAKLTELEKNSSLGPAYRRQWIDQTKEIITTWQNEAAQDAQRTQEEENNLREAAANQLSIATQSRYIPLVGGFRKSAVETWAGTVKELFRTINSRKAYEFERMAHESIVKFLDEHMPKTVPQKTDVANALLEAERFLLGMRATESENLNLLRKKPTQLLIGNGNTVVFRKEKKGLSIRESIELDFNEFKKEVGIDKSEDYLQHYQGEPRKLASLFLDHSLKKLEGDLKSISLQEAMETIGQDQGDAEAFITEQIQHLFRLASGLWAFNRGMLTAIRDPHYDKITNLGVSDKETGKERYDQFVRDTKTKYHIKADHTFSSTGDRYRIWLLNFSAALPIYALNDLSNMKRKYESQITPTYHIDPIFEMNVPDVFPANEIDNIALRVLGMAIVPGIDVIHDKKLTKGHKFTCSAQPILDLNFGEPLVWYLFRDMYQQIKDEYNPKTESNVLDILKTLLIEKITSLPEAQLKKLIEAYITKVREKLEDRDFSRLISARLTYREIKELEKFIKRGSGHYAMDIHRYISGRT